VKATKRLNGGKRDVESRVNNALKLDRLSTMINFFNQEGEHIYAHKENYID